MKIKLYTYDTRKQRMVFAGTYNSSLRCFTKKVNNKHYMIKEHGYGIQEDIVQKLFTLGCKTIYIRTKTKLMSFNFKQCYDNAIPVNYGHGFQRFIRIK